MQTRKHNSNNCPAGFMDLFDQMREPEPPLDGRALRDIGLDQAADHANEVHENWTGKAMEFLKKYIGYTKTPFMAEDVRRAAELAEGNPVPNPPHKRAWGRVFMEASAQGLITKLGYAPVTNPLAHRTPATKWQAAA